MPKHQTERQTTDMTDREEKIKEEEKEGFNFSLLFVSSLFLFFLFFSFFNCFRKKNKLLSNERFFF